MAAVRRDKLHAKHLMQAAARLGAIDGVISDDESLALIGLEELLQVNGMGRS
jgi:hypothetical protein